MSQVDCYNCGKMGHYARDCDQGKGKGQRGARGAASKESDEDPPVNNDAKRAKASSAPSTSYGWNTEYDISD
jgi:hypothetical protein